MRVLSIVHQPDAGGGVFHEVVARRGHDLEQWMPAGGELPGAPLDAYGAVLVFGGAMHAGDEADRPWLRPEKALLGDAVAAGPPVLGVCLGAQLLADVAGGDVGPSPTPEVGWHEVALEPAAADDPVLGSLPQRFCAFQWHEQAFSVPPGAAALARNDAGTQAFRAGTWTWGVQFHAEVTHETAQGWLDDYGDGLPEQLRVDRAALAAETARRIGDWNRLGAELCERFLAVAESRP